MLTTAEQLLPEGKLIRTIHGGEDTLKKSLIKLKKYEFTGYAKSIIPREGSYWEGYLIIKNGIPVAAVYGKRDGDDFRIQKQGEKALKLAWVDSYDEKCQIEVRGRVEIDQFLMDYPEASITVVKGAVPKSRMKVGLSWGDKAGDSGDKADEQPVPDIESKEKKALEQEMEKWKSEGFVVMSLEPALEGSLADAQKTFNEFRDNIRKVNFFRENLEAMDTTGHEQDVKKLEALFKNPMKITAIEAAMADLSEKVEIVEDKADMSILIDEPSAPPKNGKPSGYGEVISSAESKAEDRCGICGGDMKGQNECPICGAVKKDMKTKKETLATLMKTKDTGLITDFTFESFVVGENNRFSQAAALAVAKSGSSSYNPLLICSGAGLGKTHIINAIGNYVVQHDQDNKVLYITTEKFIQEFIDATKSNRMKAFRNKYRKIDYLLLDDIQFIAEQEAVQDELFHTFNALHKDDKQIVMTSDRPLREISGIKERLVSRFESGLVTDMQAPDFETRVSILRKKSETAGFVVGDDILKIIAKMHISNIRMLEGALNKVIAYCELMDARPTPSVVAEVLDDEPKEVVEEPPAAKEEDIFKGGIKSDKLKIAHSYLVEEDKPQKCFELFVETLDLGYQGMCISRTNPRRLTGDFDFGDAEVLWLTDRDSSGVETISPALEKIIYKIEDLLNTGKKGILLIDGLEYLISNSNFEAVLRFLRRLVDEISESNAIFLMSITPETLDPQDLKTLEREMEVINF